MKFLKRFWKGKGNNSGPWEVEGEAKANGEFIEELDNTMLDADKRIEAIILSGKLDRVSIHNEVG